MPTWYENRIKRNTEYAKKNMKQIRFVLNKNTNQDLIDYLETKENVNKYLRDLIIADMEKNK